MVLDEDMQNQIRDLRKKRGIVKSALTRMKHFVEEFDPTTDAISLLEFRQEELPRLNQKFDDIQTHLELIVVDDYEKEEEERSKFEGDYFNIRSQIQEIVNARKNLNSSMQTSMNVAANQSRVQLPPIKIPEFDGNIQDWEAFFDCFRAMVHEDDGFTSTQKFYYLRSCITGAALDLIKSVPMTEANYEVAIDRLKHRYDNRSLIIQSHIRSLLDAPYVEKASSKELQALHAHVCSHVAALKALDQPTDQWDAWLVTIIVSRLDTATSHGWQLNQKNTLLPKYSDLEKFLASRCVAFENSEVWPVKVNEVETTQQSISKKWNSERKSKKVSLVANNIQSVKCPCCTRDHKIYQCEEFKALNANDRLNIVRDARLCFNCLSSFHLSNTCKSTRSCDRCGKKHNNLLHLVDQWSRRQTDQGEAQSNSNDNAAQSSTIGALAAIPATVSNSYAFLATAVVNVKDNRGTDHRCRAVLDSGSQLNFISKRLANLLQLPSQRVMMPIGGIGASKVNSVSSVELKVNSLVKRFDLNLSCHILPMIVNDLQSVSAPKDGWGIPNELIAHLADPKFCESRQVDLLIGGGMFFELLETKRISIGSGSLCLQDSKFGWIITGEIGTVCLLSIGQGIEEDWLTINNHNGSDFGQSSRANQRCVEEEQTVLHFKEHTRRNNDGRFIVRLPMKDNCNELGNSIIMATSRFLGIERRLTRDSNLKEEYTKFMSEYINLGHMQEVQKESIIPRRSWYLPHHAVIKASSLTTKIRVVFDASAKGSNGLSLNDTLMSGPTVQQSLFAILIRFRKHEYTLTSDVEKMYRQVSVDKEDWDLQRILWRANPDEPLRTYHLTTVTYGTTPASFLATQCLVALAEETEHQYPIAAKAIRHDFYMDDLMSGADTVEECCRLQQEISVVMESAKLPLRKWCSNSETVLRNVGKRVEDPLYTLEVKEDESVKYLGLEWQPMIDKFQFTIHSISTRTKITKRTLLSDLNRIFDPLGFLAPVLIKGKIFIQQLWQLKIDWDAPLQDNIRQRWQLYYTQIEDLKELSIPRKAKPGAADIFELHGFCDASIEAYGACVYVRSFDQEGQWHSRLLCSKTRVAPLKSATVPRLELSAALLLVQLAVKVAQSWGTDVKDFRFCSDSMVVLGWLNSQTSRLKTYVANRVEQILEVTDVRQWHYINTNENPADVVSRGLTPQGLANSNIWWYGPPWLVQDTHTWKASETPLSKQELPEQRSLKLALTVTKVSTPWLLEQYSEWTILIRITAYVLRFVQNSKIAKNDVLNRIKGPLTTEELLRSKYHWIRVAQNQTFANEINALKSNTTVHRSSCLKTLSPFLDEYGIVRVGGRLTYAPISNSKKHPIVLPARCKVTSLIFIYEHKRLLHIGPQGLLAHLQNTYWPIRGRIIARRVVNKCIICFRARPTMLEPFMAPLPRERVTKDRVFANSGVDFCGPFMIRSGLRRVTPIKHYIALFVCLVTRAIHLELVRDLSSDAFLAAFFRFISRRGQCAKLFSDNGTNFVGANKILKSWLNTAQDDARIASKLSEMGIYWTFIPPASPHFGGLWESGVKSAKHHLTRVVKSALLSYEEMVTLLCRVEAVLNSRPITPLSSDPADYEALTPGHFLVGGPLTLPPEPDHSEVPLNRLRHFTLIQSRLQLFWKRWSSEYLPQMQRRGRWTSPSRTPSIGDLVILQDNLLPPIRWQLVRVTKLHPGADNVVRVVTVRNSSGQEFRRPVVKIALLPTDEDEDKDLVEN